MKNQKYVEIEINEELYRKICYIAQCKERSLDSELLQLVKENIEEFEEKHGKIERIKGEESLEEK